MAVLVLEHLGLFLFVKPLHILVFPDDRGREEDQEILFFHGIGLVPEEPTKSRDVPQPGHLGHARTDSVLHQAAYDDGLPVPDEDRVGGLPFGRSRPHAVGVLADGAVDE